MPALCALSFDGGLLERGFWLYVWEITTPKCERVFYVGRTGDSSSSNAQSPFNRMSHHLGFRKESNALRRHLQANAIEPESCSFRLVAYGPLHGEGDDQDEHLARRDLVAAMEKALAVELGSAGYHVLNTVNCRTRLDKEAFAEVRTAFAKHFSKLGQAS